MILESPINVPERMLLYGHGGSGKSTAALSVLRYTAGDMYVIDTDYSHSYERAIATEFSDIDESRLHVEAVDSDSWEEILPAVRKQAEAAQKGDWLVLDSITPTWGAVQSSYIRRRHGEDFLDAFALSGVDASRSREDADMNWTAINAEYNKLYKALMGSPANVIITAEQDAIGDKDDAKVKTVFGGVGFKPKGQKSLGHVTHTVLLLSKTRVGEYQFTTVKDRGVKDVEDKKIIDFGRDYLLGTAGWRVVKVEGES